MMRMVIHRRMLGELEAGDLYTHFEIPETHTTLGGIMVTIRDNEPLPEKADPHMPVYRLEIHRDDDED